MIDNSVCCNRSTSTNQANNASAINNNDQQRGIGFQKQAFERINSKNPGHDGCNVSQEQVEAAQASEVNAASQSAESQKASGACPGGNLIAQILQDLVAALESAQQGNR